MSSTVGPLGIPWPMWGSVCVVVAGIYTVVRPHAAQFGSPGAAWRKLVLSGGHALVWVMLAGSCYLRITDWAWTSATANVFALLALPVYALWIAVYARALSSGRDLSHLQFELDETPTGVAGVCTGRSAESRRRARPGLLRRRSPKSGDP
jgi:hypothetical protein